MKKLILVLMVIFCVFFVEASITDMIAERFGNVVVEKVNSNSLECKDINNSDCLEGVFGYCENGTLIQDCFKCGCAEGYSCEPENRTCVMAGVFKIEQSVGVDETVVLDKIIKKDEALNAIRLIPISFLGSNNLIINLDGVKLILTLDIFGKPKVNFEMNENA